MIPRPARRSVLLIDLDGTLVDTAPDLASALNRLLAESGLPGRPLNEVARMVGDGARRLVEQSFAAAGTPLSEPALADRIARFLDLYGAAPAAESRPYPGVGETLHALGAAGWRLGVCTNKAQGLSEAVLADLDLMRHFEAVAGGDRFAVKKPDPGHVRETLALLRAAPHDAVMVGDNRNDVAAAHGAGVPAIAVRYGYLKEPAVGLGAERVIDRFDELPAALAALDGPASRPAPAGPSAGDRRGGATQRTS